MHDTGPAGIQHALVTGLMAKKAAAAGKKDLQRKQRQKQQQQKQQEADPGASMTNNPAFDPMID
jgi:hypothetical protein